MKRFLSECDVWLLLDFLFMCLDIFNYLSFCSEVFSYFLCFLLESVFIVNEDQWVGGFQKWSSSFFKKMISFSASTIYPAA